MSLHSHLSLSEYLANYGEDAHEAELEALQLAAAQLAEARKAHADQRRAESEMSRLRKIRGRPTPGMRDDMDRWAKLATESAATLRRILGGAS